ncbi:MAG: TIGR02757 family protein [Saprospiraceae bacterium]|nr:TIGR02757 family protein [Saprospiraceae bacterium]
MELRAHRKQEVDELRQLLEPLVLRFNRPEFIQDDPISIPHRFTRKQDIEIAGLWTAVLSWGRRKTICDKALQLMEWMDFEPWQFVCNHAESDRKPFSRFVHRTFNAEDALCFLDYFKSYYGERDSLEFLFQETVASSCVQAGSQQDIAQGLVRLRADFERRVPRASHTLKHLSSPASGSRCKRLLMYLRWMVRRDDAGVDFGIWRSIEPAHLLMPLDVHVERSARELGMFRRKQNDWKAVLELSETCRRLDPLDPVRYDFALFGLGLEASGNELPPSIVLPRRRRSGK